MRQLQHQRGPIKGPEFSGGDRLLKVIRSGYFLLDDGIHHGINSAADSVCRKTGKPKVEVVKTFLHATTATTAGVALAEISNSMGHKMDGYHAALNLISFANLLGAIALTLKLAPCLIEIFSRPVAGAADATKAKADKLIRMLRLPMMAAGVLGILDSVRATHLGLRPSFSGGICLAGLSVILYLISEGTGRFERILERFGLRMPVVSEATVKNE